MIRRREPVGKVPLVLRSFAVVVLAVAAGSGLSSCSGGGSRYIVHAVFGNGQGLYPGAAVEVLGVEQGTVTEVANAGNNVAVTLSLPDTEHLPADVHAALVEPQLLGEPDVDLFPGYTGGLAMAPGATIPIDHTSVPVSIGELLRQLKNFLGGIDATSASALIHNLSVDFQGEGSRLNELIRGAAGTLKVLADKGSQLGQLEGNLASVTGTLDGHLSAIEDLIVSYDTVSGVIASHDSQLNDAITQLTGATTQVANLLSPRLAPLESDIGTITTVGRTLDRNITNLDQTLQSTVALFAAGHRSYNPTYNWINLNLATPSGMTQAYLLGLVRDRLAGVCRRIVANHSQGLSAAQLAALDSCGNPASGFFQPLINAILAGSPGNGSGPANMSEIFTAGLKQIPGLTAGQVAALSQNGSGS